MRIREIPKDGPAARGQSAHVLWMALQLPASRVRQTVLGGRGINPDTASRLARYFGGSATIWTRLQTTYELAQVEDTLAAKIASEVTPAPA